MGQKCTREDFEWSCNKEPHAKRRKIIVEKYPQIKKLFGYDPLFKWIVTFMVLVQIAMLFIIKHMTWPYLVWVAYCFGGVLNHSLMLAIHEIAHNLAFGHSRPMHNRLFGFFANLPIGLPVSVSFKKYHLEHHRYQGDDLKDTDLPTYLEGKLFNTTFGKFIWVILQPLFYSFRPLVVYPMSPSNWEYANALIQFTFDGIVCYYFGWRSLVYLIIASLLAMGFHPVAGHFISEHYMFKVGHETYSYYGPLNWITFNVGFHNEHHDFPAVPGSKLPEVRRIAKEFYEPLPHHNSWSAVIYDFIMDPDVGPFARIKRKSLGYRT